MCRSKYDSIAAKIVGKIMNDWTKKGPVSMANSTITIKRKNLEFDVIARIFFIDKPDFGFEVLDSTGADAREFDDDGTYQTPYILIDFAVNHTWLPNFWSEIYMILCDVVRHEIEHITQEGEVKKNYRKGKPGLDDSIEREMIKMKLLPTWNYYLLPKEVDANLQGLRFEAKKRRVPIIKMVNKYLDSQELEQEHRDIIFSRWRQRAKEIGGIPQF